MVFDHCQGIRTNEMRESARAETTPAGSNRDVMSFTDLELVNSLNSPPAQRGSGSKELEGSHESPSGGGRVKCADSACLVGRWLAVLTSPADERYWPPRDEEEPPAPLRAMVFPLEHGSDADLEAKACWSCIHTENANTPRRLLGCDLMTKKGKSQPGSPQQFEGPMQSREVCNGKPLAIQVSAGCPDSLLLPWQSCSRAWRPAPPVSLGALADTSIPATCFS